MTDEERQKLCASLRLAFSPWPCRIAADEIERLAKDNKQLEVEVADLKELMRYMEVPDR